MQHASNYGYQAPACCARCGSYALDCCDGGLAEAFAAGVAMARDYIATCPYQVPSLKRAWLEGIFSTIPCESKS